MRLRHAGWLAGTAKPYTPECYPLSYAAVLLIEIRRTLGPIVVEQHTGFDSIQYRRRYTVGGQVVCTHSADVCTMRGCILGQLQPLLHCTQCVRGHHSPVASLHSSTVTVHVHTTDNLTLSCTTTWLPACCINAPQQLHCAECNTRPIPEVLFAPHVVTRCQPRSNRILQRLEWPMMG